MYCSSSSSSRPTAPLYKYNFPFFAGKNEKKKKKQAINSNTNPPKIALHCKVADSSSCVIVVDVV